MNRILVGVGLPVLVWVSATSAYTIDGVSIESWAGTGSNEVLLVVDFWPDNGADDSFAFGYRFETPSITGQDLLNGLAAATNGLTFADGGGFVSDFWYDDGVTVHHTGYDWPNSWWSYWGSDDFGETWAASFVGAGDRILADGDTDGWLAKPGSDSTSAPVTPVPEPGTGALLAVGAMALLRRRAAHVPGRREL